MGRRQRHFNPVHAGAGFALDARFITGLSNGASVTSWISRPGATFTFGGASNYPTYSSSVANAGNQPGVSFDSANSQRLVSTNTRVLPAGTNNFTAVEFASSGATFVSIAQRGATNTGIGCLFGNAFDFVLARGYFEWINGSNVPHIINLTGSVPSGGFVFSARQNGTAQRAQVNLETPSTRTSSGSLRAGTTGTANNFRTGVHHAGCLFNAALSDSLLRRIVDHYAFSFKSTI